MKLFDNVTSFDELNVISTSHEIYDEAYELVEKEATRLVKSVYGDYHESQAEEENAFNAAVFVAALLLAYNPVTKYVFKNEIDRKRSRFAEGVISSETPREEISKAKRLLLGITAQFMDDVTFDSMIQAYEDDGVTEVKWITAEDDKRCKECKSRHGKIYPIDRIPSKPHIHCRCWVERVQR
jgi:SPP1 gp7 family putative phage head morphogenesis protein